MFLDLDQELTVASLASLKTDRGLTIGITSGCYDLTHYYHLRYWQRCKNYCDILIVGVDNDRLVKAVKGDTRPVFEEKHRLALVESSRCVDAVFLMNEVKDFERMIDAVGVDFIFKNQDFRGKTDLFILGSDKVKDVIYVDDIEEITSTSAFIKKIKESS